MARDGPEGHRGRGRRHTHEEGRGRTPGAARQDGTFRPDSSRHSQNRGRGRGVGRAGARTSAPDAPTSRGGAGRGAANAQPRNASANGVVPRPAPPPLQSAWARPMQSPATRPSGSAAPSNGAAMPQPAAAHTQVHVAPPVSSQQQQQLQTAWGPALGPRPSAAPAEPPSSAHEARAAQSQPGSTRTPRSHEANGANISMGAGSRPQMRPAAVESKLSPPPMQTLQASAQPFAPAPRGGPASSVASHAAAVAALAAASAAPAPAPLPPPMPPSFATTSAPAKGPAVLGSAAHFAGMSIDEMPNYGGPQHAPMRAAYGAPPVMPLQPLARGEPATVPAPGVPTTVAEGRPAEVAWGSAHSRWQRLCTCRCPPCLGTR